MKKITVLFIAVMLLLSIAGCGTGNVTDSTQPGTSDIANPWTEYSSLEELNEHFMCRLAHPGVMGVTDESFTGLETESSVIAQYKFTLNGYEYTFRFSPFYDRDISGIYVSGGTLFENVTGDANASTSDCKAARWMNTDGQYCLAVHDDGKMDASLFSDIADEMAELTFPGVSESEKQSLYDSLEGSYEDSFSERAVMDITSDEGFINVLVSWGSGARETDSWQMTVTLAEDGLLNYSDCTHLRHTWDEDDNETAETLAEDQSGFFSIDETGNLCWIGAADESCCECVFEKI